MPFGSLNLTYSAQYDSRGILEQYGSNAVQQKSSPADVVSAVLSGETPTPTTSFQISLSACMDSERAFEVRAGGGALRKVSVIQPVRHLHDLSFLVDFTGFH